MVETKKEFRISRGGATVRLTEVQEREAQSLALADIRKGGGGVVFFGRDPAIVKRAGFLSATRQAKFAITQRGSSK